MAKKAKAEYKEPVALAEYHLANHEKLDRAINGSVGQGGQMQGGVGKDATEAQILAEYDKLGGLILKQTIVQDVNEEGDQVEKVEYLKLATGSFWDFKEGKPKETPVAKFVKNEVRGGVVVDEVSDAEPKKKSKKSKTEE